MGLPVGSKINQKIRTMKNEKELLFVVGDFEVYNDTVYVVTDKPDYDAPSGFIEKGITRLPSDGVGDTFECGFSSQSKGSKNGLWDTGFYTGSKCYAKLNGDSKHAADARTKLAVENVMKPYAANIGDINKLAQNQDNDFWTTKLMDVYSGQVFNTKDSEDRFQLYFALLTKHLTPEGLEGDSSFKKSSYIVKDINKNMKRKDEKALIEFEAIASFMDVLKTNKNRITSILDYLGMTVNKDLANGTLMAMFKELIGRDESKLKLYNSLMEESKTNDGMAKLELYKILKSKYPNGGVTKSHNGVYFYKDEEIGGDLKTAAQNIATQKQFSEIKKDLLLADD